MPPNSHMEGYIYLLALLFLRGSLCRDEINIKAEAGQNVTVTCRAPENGQVAAVSLTRDELDPKYVLLYRDERIDEESQNPLFRERTNLQILDPLNREVNVILNNVRKGDTGRYVCMVKFEEKNRRRRKRAFSETIINLNVAPPRTPPPHTPSPLPPTSGGGHNGLIVGMAIATVALIAGSTLIAGFLLKQKRAYSSPENKSQKHLNDLVAPENSRLCHDQTLSVHPGKPAIREAQDNAALMPVPSLDRWGGLI